jgi:MFS family permease
MNNYPGNSTIAQSTQHQLSRGAAFFLLASITISFLAGSLAPTPLYPVYQAKWGLSALSVTEIFGIYAIALLGSLLVAGRLSDHIGRKPILIVATIVQSIVMLMFATANNMDVLMLARIIQGLATGAALGAVGAGMLDLDKLRGPIANAVAPPLGTGLGGLLTGLFVHYLPAPTVLIYVVLGVVFLLQTVGVIFMGETVSKKPGALASLKPHLSVPVATREAVILAVPMLVAGWSMAGFYGALVPALLRMRFGVDPSLASGLAAFALAGSAAFAVLVLQRKEARWVMNYGTAALMLGTTAVVLSLTFHSAVIFFLGTILAGSGFGASFQGAVRTIVPLAHPHERAGVLSVIFIVSYLAMGVPAIMAGFFVAKFGNLLMTAQVFATVVIILAGIALAKGLIREKK